MPRGIKKSSPKKPATGQPRKRGRPRKIEQPKTQPVAGPIEEKPKLKRYTYLFAVGRRKSAIARVRYYRKGTGQYVINNQPVDKYFSNLEFQMICQAPITALSLKLDGDISVRVLGGGLRGQADSIRHGLARILCLLDKNHRPTLKKLDFLKRDARVKERKKYGLKRARRAPQWQKR